MDPLKKKAQQQFLSESSERSSSTDSDMLSGQFQSAQEHENPLYFAKIDLKLGNRQVDDHYQHVRLLAQENSNSDARPNENSSNLLP